MRRFTLIGIAVAVTSFGLLDVHQAVGQVRVYQRPFLGDIGYANIDRQGNPYVVINPRMCRRMGPELCGFFRNHELAHHRLRHFHRNISVQQAEAEADRWAAMNSSPGAVRAAQRYFARGRGGSRQHGTSWQRYYRVAGR